MFIEVTSSLNVEYWTPGRGAERLHFPQQRGVPEAGKRGTDQIPSPGIVIMITVTSQPTLYLHIRLQVLQISAGCHLPPSQRYTSRLTALVFILSQNIWSHWWSDSIYVNFWLFYLTTYGETIGNSLHCFSGNQNSKCQYNIHQKFCCCAVTGCCWDGYVAEFSAEKYWVKLHSNSISTTVGIRAISGYSSS